MSECLAQSAAPYTRDSKNYKPTLATYKSVSMTRFKKADPQILNTDKTKRVVKKPVIKRPIVVFSSREKTKTGNQIVGWVNEDMPLSDLP
jgi:hypothetical protein